MKTRIIAAAISLAGLTYTLPAAAEALVKFEGGIGVHPVSNLALAPNTVKGVPPGGLPWAIQKLEVEVETDGSITVKGEGLVLAAGDNIGTRGGVANVFATLFCGNDAFHSPAAALSLGGNFRIRGMLSAVPPGPCDAPRVLIRNAAGNNPGLPRARSTNSKKKRRPEGRLLSFRPPTRAPTDVSARMHFARPADRAFNRGEIGRRRCTHVADEKTKLSLLFLLIGTFCIAQTI